jgi:LuxR family maltose regulon positive regulatory protein
MNQVELVPCNAPSFAGDVPRIAVTRTTPPGIKEFAIERQRLLGLLDKVASCRVIAFKAPAGYGKTTLAAEWCQHLRQSGAIVAWLSLDADDNVPGTFACHVAAAVDRAAPDLAQPAIELLQQSSLINPRVVLSTLVNAASETDSEIFLVLDDFHLITDTRSLELMTFLLRYASSNLHLVVLSRSELRLPLSKLRMEGEIAELDAAEIRFTLDETKLLLGAKLTRSLRPSGVSQLYSATEGWPAAVQLARIVLRNCEDPSGHVQGLSGTSRNIASYLDDTLAAQPPEIVEFLLQTSILDQFNGELCQAVTKLPQSAELLAGLEREQLLLFPLDGAGGWYRYHRLMSEFLADRLHTRMNGQVAKLHRRAYAWYASQQMWTQAVHHAIAAKDLDQAVRFIEHCAMNLVMRGDLLTLLGWEQQLPSELIRGQLHTKLALAWGMALVTRFAEADALLSQVESVARADLQSELWWKCRAARAVLLSLTDNSERAREDAMECLRSAAYNAFNQNNLHNAMRFGYLKAGEWAEFYAVPKSELVGDDDSYVLAESYRLCLYGMAAVQQLRCDEALGYYADAKQVAEKYAGAKSVTSACVTCLIAEVVYEQGDVCGAEIAVMDDLDLIETAAFHEAFLRAYLVLVRAARARGEVQHALSLLNRAERLAWERGWPRVVAALLVERVRLLLAEKRFDEAQSLLQPLEALKADHPASVARCSWAEIHSYCAIANGLVADASGRSETAAEILLGAFQQLLSTSNRLAALRVGVELALAHHRSGDETNAFDVLRQVLASAARAGMMSFALDHQPELSQLIAAWIDSEVSESHGPLRIFAADLLTRIHQHETPRQASGSRPARQSLTDRECKIIAFIAGGQSNKEIARALGVAPETIKTHIKRIFVKLSAETRAQAVVRAQSLGLLRGATAEGSLAS